MAGYSVSWLNALDVSLRFFSNLLQIIRPCGFIFYIYRLHRETAPKVQSSQHPRSSDHRHMGTFGVTFGEIRIRTCSGQTAHAWKTKTLNSHVLWKLTYNSKISRTLGLLSTVDVVTEWGWRLEKTQPLKTLGTHKLFLYLCFNNLILLRVLSSLSYWTGVGPLLVSLSRL